MLDLVNSQQFVKNPRFSLDYTQLNEREFIEALKSYTDLEELEGLANRRRVLNAPELPRWLPWQREQILKRKWELENGRA
mgnify:CR=1 FL=1|tara:strand:+ start:1920 stop:2159 length:240 start_codon:yes stop_codon:yes gene_type:complete